MSVSLGPFESWSALMRLTSVGECFCGSRCGLCSGPPHDDDEQDEDESTDAGLRDSETAADQNASPNPLQVSGVGEESGDDDGVGDDVLAEYVEVGADMEYPRDMPNAGLVVAL